MKQSNSSSKSKKSFSLSLRVLGYQLTDGSWAAHCLETDLVGYGNNFEEAFAKLEEMTEMQISFALQTNQPSLIYHPAPPDILEIYHTLLQSTLQHYMKKTRLDKTHRVASISLPAISSPPDHCFVPS